MAVAPRHLYKKQVNMKKAIIILSVLAIFVSCNQQKTVQTYIVEKQEKPGFMSVDLPMSLIQLNTDKAPLEVKEKTETVARASNDPRQKRKAEEKAKEIAPE